MVLTNSESKAGTGTEKRSRKLGRFDQLLLITLTSIFLVCIGLHIKMVFGDGMPLTSIRVEIGNGPDDPPVVVSFATERRGDARLQIGDRLLSVGEVDLRGISYLGYHVAMAEQVRYGKTAAVRAERNGKIVTEYIKATNGKLPWSHIPFVIGFAAIAFIVLLRAPDLQDSRLFFSAFMSVAIFQTSISDGSAFQLILRLSYYVDGHPCRWQATQFTPTARIYSS